MTAERLEEIRRIAALHRGGFTASWNVVRELLAEVERQREALIRCAELSGSDGEQVEAARSGALTRPSIAEWAIEEVAQLRREYDAFDGC